MWRICSDNGWWSVFGKKKAPQARQGRNTGPRRPGPPRLHSAGPEPALADRPDGAPHRRGQALPLRDQGRVVEPNRRLLDQDRMESSDRRRRARLSGRPPQPARSPAARLHSDRGSQFRSRKLQQSLWRHRMIGSMGQVGSAGDNAAMESFFSLLQKNVLDRQRWETREQLRIAIITWIERTYHRRRRQAAPRPIDPDRVRNHHEPRRRLRRREQLSQSAGGAVDQDVADGQLDVDGQRLGRWPRPPAAAPGARSGR